MNFLRRIFGRKQPAPDPPINEDWRVGDLAVCIDGAFKHDWPFNPKKDDVLRVSELHVHSSNEGRFWCLRFHGKPSNKGWDARAFRKPIADNKPAEAEFGALIRKRKPVGA